MISTHILDTTKGQPAAGVKVTLEKRDHSAWARVDENTTNTDGRIVFNSPYDAGEYRLTFDIEAYFEGQDSFFLNPQIAFKVKDTKRKYHVPIILNPFGLSTYRGS